MLGSIDGKCPLEKSDSVSIGQDSDFLMICERGQRPGIQPLADIHLRQRLWRRPVTRREQWFRQPAPSRSPRISHSKDKTPTFRVEVRSSAWSGPSSHPLGLFKGAREVKFRTIVVPTSHRPRVYLAGQGGHSLSTDA